MRANRLECQEVLSVEDWAENLSTFLSSRLAATARWILGVALGGAFPPFPDIRERWDWVHPTSPVLAALPTSAHSSAMAVLIGSGRR
jgi:hypothetical protein